MPYTVTVSIPSGLKSGSGIPEIISVEIPYPSRYYVGGSRREFTYEAQYPQPPKGYLGLIAYPLSFYTPCDECSLCIGDWGVKTAVCESLQTNNRFISTYRYLSKV